MTQPHDQFSSPFSWRYGSQEMRHIWSEVNKRRLWRTIWLELARAQQAAGLVTSDQLADLEAHVSSVDIARAETIEAEIQHDLMAEVRVYAEQCSIGGGIIHLGATSADIEDNADVLRMRDSLDLIVAALHRLLAALSDKIDQYAGVVTIAFTHLQPAEPTTIGYRLALYAQDLLDDFEALRRVRDSLRGKGLKGAVGTGASYADLLANTSMTPSQLEARVMSALNLVPYPITSQTYPRKQDWQVLSALAGVAGSLYKFAFDLRLLQSPLAGEWHEPFARQQVGSSAMPFKRNPIQAEKINSLARLVVSMTQVAWDNAAHALLERTLDDSANRREILPVAFLATDELLHVACRIVTGMQIDESASAQNIEHFGVFSAVERVLMAAVKAGADRQKMHEVLREQSFAAMAAVARGEKNPLVENVLADPELQSYLPSERLRELFDATSYVGDALERARNFAADIHRVLAKDV
jgi:adenylosuccinate lyase